MKKPGNIFRKMLTGKLAKHATLMVGTIMMCWLMFASGSSFAENILPNEIGSKLSNEKILDAAKLTGYGQDDCWFVVTRNGQKENVLYYFKQEKHKWIEKFHNSAIVPQTDRQIEIHIDTEGIDYDTGSIAAPLLIICQMNSANEYAELTLRFALEKGKWNLHSIESYIGYDHMLFQDGVITFYESSENLEVAGRAYGVIQRDLQNLSLSAIPKTLKAAKKILSNPPKIPVGTLTAEKIKFTGGKKYSVYTGPGSDYFRGANGKAVVSTNDWIQVFGKENGWIMIQYDITSDHFRVGWIKENALPRKAEVKDLLFSDEQVYTTVQCPLTDDPLASKTEIDRIAAGVKVSRLALMGEWSYVESGYGSSLMRGFIESENLTKLSVAQVEWLAQTEAQNIASGKETGEETPLIYVNETNYRPESGQWEVKIEFGEGNFTVFVDDITGDVVIEK